MENAYGFIYVTENCINHKKYIGKRCYDADGRWQNYLGSGIALRRAIKKYGKSNFTRTIIDSANSLDELNNKERYWIGFYDAVKSDDYYNLAGGGDGGNTKLGYSEEEYWASESKRILAVTRSGRMRCCDKAPSAKLTSDEVREIINLLLLGDFHTDIAKHFNVSPATINDIAKHKTWAKMTDGIDFPNITRRRVGKRSAKSTSKSVLVYDMDMNYIGKYPSARAAEEALDVGFRLISQVCLGQKKSAHGYIFRFE